MALCIDVVNVSLTGVGRVDYLTGGSIHQILAPSTTQTIDTCTTYVLQTVQEYQSLPTLTDVFTMPLAADLGQMWMIGFSLPMITYLTAWGYGVVINWFNEKHH